MRKARLSLHRETLRRMSGADLARAAGGTQDVPGTQTIGAETSRAPACPVKVTQPPVCLVASG
jgi:hypothetical protein